MNETKIKMNRNFYENQVDGFDKVNQYL